MVAFHLSDILYYRKSRHKEPGTHILRVKEISMYVPTKQKSFFTEKVVLIYVHLCKNIECFFIQSHNIYENSTFITSIYPHGSFTYF